MAQTADEFISAHIERLNAYVRLRVPVSDRDDVAAEILLRAVERFGQLNGDPTAWLFAIARTRIADHYRGKGTGMNAHLTLAGDEVLKIRPEAKTLEPLAALEQAEFRALLQAKMALLSEQERDVIAMKFTDGLSNIQIAEALELTPSNLGVILHRALKRLRDAMLS